MMGRKYERAVETRFYPCISFYVIEGTNGRTSRKNVAAKP